MHPIPWKLPQAAIQFAASRQIPVDFRTRLHELTVTALRRAQNSRESGRRAASLFLKSGERVRRIAMSTAPHENVVDARA